MHWINQLKIFAFTLNPFNPFITTSEFPGVLVVTIGNFEAIDSNNDLGSLLYMRVDTRYQNYLIYILFDCQHPYI